MDSNIMLSVLIPTYNNAQFITKAIASSLALKYLNEIVIVDDYSTDKTEGLIKKIQKKNNVIKYFKNKKNIGAGKSFLGAIKKSSSPYILMLNSDDFFIPNGIDNLFNYMLDNNLDLAYGKMAIQKKNKIFRYNHPGYYKDSYINKRNEFVDLLIFDMYMPSFGTIIKKSVLENFYDENYLKKLDRDFGAKFKAHDYDLFLNLSKKKINLGFLNEFVCVWKPEENSQSGSSYFSSGCALAESAFLFNRYANKEIIENPIIVSKIYSRIREKFPDLKKLKKNIYKIHFKKFTESIGI